MSGASSYNRTFICLDVLPWLDRSLSAIGKHIHDTSPRNPPTDPRNAHLTLAFLGGVTQDQTAAVSALLDAVCTRNQPFTLSLSGGGFFGPKNRPSVIWAGVKPEPALMRLQRDIAQVVASAGITLETRPFRPHLTILRVRSALPPPALTSIIACINNTHFAEIPVDRVLFMNSQLNGSGPRYATIHESILKGS